MLLRLIIIFSLCYSFGYSQKSFSFNLNVLSPCNTNEVKVNEFINLVYPNPASKSLTIKNEEYNSCSIIDLNGKLLIFSEIQYTTSSIDVSSLNKGIYFVQLESVTKKLITKIIIE